LAKALGYTYIDSGAMYRAVALYALRNGWMNETNIDEEALRNLVEFQIKEGTNGIVPCGTTGESATLTYDEHCKVIDIVIDQAKKRVPVIAGTGSNSTHETIYFTKHAKEAGADAALIITPYYNKPTQKGLYEHFKSIAENVDIPIIIYNVPGRTACNILPDTVIALSKIKNIVGIKEASLSLDQAAQIIKEAHQDFIVLSGEDSLTYPLLCIGAKGVISVASNIVPKKMSEMCKYIKIKIMKKLEISIMNYLIYLRLFL